MRASALPLPSILATLHAGLLELQHRLPCLKPVLVLSPATAATLTLPDYRNTVSPDARQALDRDLDQALGLAVPVYSPGHSPKWPPHGPA